MTTASQAFLSTAATRSRRASCSGVAPPLRGRLALLNVQMMGRDVPLDRRRHLARNRFPALDVFADSARRHVRRALEAQDHAAASKAGCFEVSWLWRPAARTSDHDDRRQASHRLRLMPGLEQPRGVPAKDEKQLATWTERPQLAKCLQCERRTWAPHLEVGH